MQQLDSNEALEVRIEGFPDLCHDSATQLLLEFIFPQASWTCTHISLSSWREISLNINMCKNSSHCLCKVQCRRWPIPECCSELARHLPVPYLCWDRISPRRHSWPA